MSKVIDLTGQRFERLVVLERAESNKRGRAMWLCQCDCGNTKTVIGSNLLTGRTRSCGCLNQELTIRHRFPKVHGRAHTRLYHIWSSLKERCLNPNYPKYRNYGRRGITVCEEWKNSFVAFYDWAMTNGYQDNLSIDRIDPNGNYEPSNCRWADAKTQQNNRRNNRFIPYKGKTKTMAEWERELSLSHGILSQRLRLGWSIEEALTTPVGGKRKTK